MRVRMRMNERVRMMENDEGMMENESFGVRVR